MSPMSQGGYSFTPLGIFLAAVALAFAGTTGSPDMRRMVNLFLGVLLLSMILLNWQHIGPLFIQGGKNPNVQG